ncbi:hypothetical protein F5B21DRAFT_505272 [Xylaria acuta]|nr:hypothetical protein F5B21DRAFT_505272 [Xylaria acuta]
MANAMQAPDFPDALSQYERCMFANLQKLADMVVEQNKKVAAMVTNVEQQIARLETRFNDFRDAQAHHRVPDRTSHEALFAERERSCRRDMKGSFCGLAEESMQLQDTNENEDDGGLLPRTPPPRTPRKEFFSATSTPSKRKASETSDLWSLRQHKDRLLGQQGPIPISFQSALRHTKAQHRELKADMDMGVLSTGLHENCRRDIWKWKADERKDAFEHDLKKSLQLLPADECSSHTPLSSFPSRMSRMPLGTDPPKKTQEGTERPLPVWVDLEKTARDIAESMSTDGKDDEPGSDETI